MFESGKCRWKLENLLREHNSRAPAEANDDGSVGSNID